MSDAISSNKEKDLGERDHFNSRTTEQLLEYLKGNYTKKEAEYLNWYAKWYLNKLVQSILYDRDQDIQNLLSKIESLKEEIEEVKSKYDLNYEN